MFVNLVFLLVKTNVCAQCIYSNRCIRPFCAFCGVCSVINCEKGISRYLKICFKTSILLFNGVCTFFCSAVVNWDPLVLNIASIMSHYAHIFSVARVNKMCAYDHKSCACFHRAFHRPVNFV